MVSDTAAQLHNGVGNNKGQTRRSRALRACSLMMMAALGFAASAFAAPISVPNADFSDSANFGHVGGNLLESSGTGAIGSGPWNGTYKGIAGILAPPRLTITSGNATISGLAGVNVLNLGLLNNDAYFSQHLTTAYVANQHYTLTATVDVGATLSLGVLASGNAGIALTRSNTDLASTSSASPSTVSVALLNGTRYQLTLTYDTGATVSGNVGVKLFAKPQNLLTASLLSSVTFSNVTLNASPLNASAASVAPADGTPQGAAVNTSFAAPFSVTVLNADGGPVSGATVTFSAPSTGPSVVLSATTVTTDANGHAQVTGVANGTVGTYVVTATVAGVATPAEFDLTNIAGTAANVGDATGTPQTANVNTDFAQPLGLTVTDAGGNPVQGITVIFSSPSSGPSANFANSATATTDASGHASVNASANTIAGSYTVTASVPGAGTAASFALTNKAGPAANSSPFGGTPQSAMVSTPFNTPLCTQITDAFGNPVQGVSVTFAPPTTGASATFPASSTIITDSNGVACVDVDANATAGDYQVTATVDGVSTPTVFSLTNTEDTVPTTTPTSGPGQDANPMAMFNCMLQLKVTDQMGNPISGYSIDFSAPTSGPSAILSNGADSGSTVTVPTDANGLAGVMATANDTPGTYDISATHTGDTSVLATYQLTNLDTADRIFQNGFETPGGACSP